MATVPEYTGFVPARNQAQGVFNTNMAQYFSYIANLAPAINTTAQEMNDTAANVAQDTAEQAAIRTANEVEAALSQYVTDASGFADNAASSATFADNMADAVAQATATYTTVAAGLSGTVSGDYFRVIEAPVAARVSVYRNDAGAATLITTYYTKTGVDAKQAAAVRLNRSLQRLGDHGQTLHSDFAYGGYGVGAQDDMGVSQPLDAEELWDVVRATSKWVEGPNGLLREVPPNTIARQWRNGVPQGALIEESRTNFILQSGTAWRAPWFSGEGAHFCREYVDGDVPFWGIESVGFYGPENGISSFSTSLSFQNVDLEAGTYSLSGLFKSVNPNGLLSAPTMRTLHRAVSGGDGTAGSLVARLYDMGGTSGSTSDTGSGVFNLTRIHECRPVGNGWYFYHETFELLGAATVQIRLFPYDARSPFTGDGETGILRTMLQLEQASSPSSYTPTEDSPVTRSADNVSRTLGEEFNAGEGTVFIDLPRLPGSPSTGRVSIGKLKQGVSDSILDAIGVEVSQGYNMRLSMFGAGGNAETSSYTPDSPSARHKIAYTYRRGGQCSLAINGVLVGSIDDTGNIADIFSSVVSFRLASPYKVTGFPVGAFAPVIALVSSEFYSPRALTEAELIEVTTL